MAKFSIDEVYGVSRAEYCATTNISPEDMIRHLEAEIAILKANYDTIQQEFVNGGQLIQDEQRRRVDLMVVIYNKIVSKREKVKDINREFIV